MKASRLDRTGFAFAMAIFVSTLGCSSSVPVETATVSKGVIRQFVDERGKSRLPETYLITMPYAGRIEHIDPIEGDPVSKDTPVARIVQQDLELAVAEARAVVERLDAAILENLDNKLEQLAVKQAEQLVRSMIETVEAAAERVKSGLAKYQYAETNLGRVQHLYQTSTVTEDEMDRARLDTVTSEVDYAQDKLVKSSIEAIKLATDILPTMVRQFMTDKFLNDAVLRKQRAEAAAQLDKVKLDQQRGTLDSPIDGVVLKRFISDERFLAAGESLLEVGRLEDLEVEVDVLSLDVVDVSVGDLAEIHGPAVGELPVRGTIQRIYPAGFTKISSLGVEQQRVKVIVGIDPEDLDRLRNEQSLGVGYRVRVRIYTDEASDALIVPRSALFRGSDSQWQLYVVRAGRAQIEEVEVGILNDRHAQITSGLNAGDQVVRSPESNLD